MWKHVCIQHYSDHWNIPWPLIYTPTQLPRLPSCPNCDCYMGGSPSQATTLTWMAMRTRSGGHSQVTMETASLLMNGMTNASTGGATNETIAPHTIVSHERDNVTTLQCSCNGGLKHTKYVCKCYCQLSSFPINQLIVINCHKQGLAIIVKLHTCIHEWG